MEHLHKFILRILHIAVSVVGPAVGVAFGGFGYLLRKIGGKLVERRIVVVEEFVPKLLHASLETWKFGDFGNPCLTVWWVLVYEFVGAAVV